MQQHAARNACKLLIAGALSVCRPVGLGIGWGVETAVNGVVKGLVIEHSKFECVCPATHLIGKVRFLQFGNRGRILF